MNLDKNMKGEWIWRGVLTGLIAIVCWFARGSFNEQKDFNTKVNERLQRIELEQAKSMADQSRRDVENASRITIADWLTSKAVIDSGLAAQDKRVTRTEDAIIVLKDSFLRIEKKLDTLKP